MAGTCKVFTFSFLPVVSHLVYVELLCTHPFVQWHRVSPTDIDGILVRTESTHRKF